jgi:hypothetical protein
MMLTIYPYLLDSTWVFDDERTGLKEEAFVCGASEMISRVVEQRHLSNASAGISLSFSDKPIADFDVQLEWLRSGDMPLLPGNWYRGIVAGQEMECWLCPALELYFDGAPLRLFVRAGPLPTGIDPVWRVDPQDPRQRRFMSAP